jgi:hypothetical protein
VLHGVDQLVVWFLGLRVCWIVRICGKNTWLRVLHNDGDFVLAMLILH